MSYWEEPDRQETFEKNTHRQVTFPKDKESCARVSAVCGCQGVVMVM